MRYNNIVFKNLFLSRLFMVMLISLTLSGCTNIEQLLTDGNRKIWGTNDFHTAYYCYDKKSHSMEFMLNYNHEGEADIGFACTPIPSYMIKGKKIITYFEYPDNYKFMLDTLDILKIRKDRLEYMSKNSMGLWIHTTNYNVEVCDTTICQAICDDIVYRIKKSYKGKTIKIHYPELNTKEEADEDCQVVCYLDKLMQHGNNEYLFCWCYITEKGENAKGRGKERKSCVRFEYTLDKKGTLAFRKEKSYRI